MEEWQAAEKQAIWLAIQLLVLLGVVTTLVLISRKFIRIKLEDAKRLSDLQIAHQKQLFSDSIRVQEKERERFANDLHDDLLSKLNILTLSCSTIKDDPTSHALLQECMQTVRRISHDLRPPLMEELDLVALIDLVIQPLEKVYEINRHFTVLEQTEIEVKTKLQILRILQEVVNNILKHAQTTQISIQLRSTALNQIIFIQDHGVGFDVNATSKGLGRRNIAMRIENLKGTYRLKSTKENGSSYLFVIPNLNSSS